jgi:hypothetical protein
MGFSRRNERPELRKTSQTIDRPDPLADEIRRQFGSTALTRYLSSLPAFSIDPGVPDRMRELLADLQKAEGRRRGRGRPN